MGASPNHRPTPRACPAEATIITPMSRPASEARTTPWVTIRSTAFKTLVYDRMVAGASPDAQPGDLVAVYDRSERLLGRGLYNPRSRIAVRMLTHDPAPLDDVFWQATLARAVSLRRDLLRIDTDSDACRLVHAEGDGLSGLVVDRYRDVLCLEVFSLGIWKRVEHLLPILHQLAGTRHHRVQVDQRVQQQEHFTAEPITSDQLPRFVNFTEHGVRFRVTFEQSHKTGFFCDQRENRARFAARCGAGTVLDACCYTGGFGLIAKVNGGAQDVTAVDLDEHAIAAARTNANLNNVRMNLVHADAFSFMRQMQHNDRRFRAVALDPPKLIPTRADTAEGEQKYYDLNVLAASLVEPGGMLLTCSCSGLMQRDAFVRVVLRAVERTGRAVQIIDETGAGPDHPVSTRCPESSYLKALWLRLA